MRENYICGSLTRKMCKNGSYVWYREKWRRRNYISSLILELEWSEVQDSRKEVILNSTVIVDNLNSFKTELDKSVEKTASVCPVLKAVNEHNLLENEQKAAKKKHCHL